ncbi:calcium-transporting P-type ATPase, PMR1-type [Clostridium sp. DJ247]|uniref:calcium-transporting P-type ATPase, PMR1-type n=1 Tax=Clostridium sp. DJ247 TaxID=2726188 RepID=UPI00162479E4|nr:calcium-transporting P-type ATPase, PMR1-type [Clostridium sp. DJ247]MBC2579482.1 calcium-transporting P-type ATPase, PMR1-type [Clostridium sp. DJ247]
MWYNKSVEETLNNIGSTSVNGLTSEEVSQRLQKFGPNMLAEQKTKSIISRIFDQLNDVMIYILLAAAVISGFLGEISDAVIIASIVVINAVIGVIQESKAEKALEALKKLSTPKAVVRRDGDLKEISSQELVPGDIVIIDTGRYIPCDLRLIETANLKIEESALTGESLPVEKDADTILRGDDTPLGDQKNMCFMSTLSIYGRGVGVVVATGMNTEIGKIAKMLENNEKDLTPLQKKLTELGKMLGIGALILCALMFIVAIFQKRDIFEMFLTAISLAVAAIPEGLPAIVTIVLAMGVQRMIKENAIIRKLPAVETLGAVNIICSDKTGTLTQNKMTVTKFYTDNTLDLISSLDINNSTHKLLLEAMVLCNDATYSENSKTGDPTEIALLEAGSKFNIFKNTIGETHKRINELPFDSDRKLMTTVNKYDNGYCVFTKGATDNLIKLCNKVYINGDIVPINDELRTNIINASNSMSNDALRVLGAAFKSVTTPHIEIDSLEKDLIFLGLMGMIDPPRDSVKDSIAQCKKSGIRTVMITGDHKITALAIAKELGIAENESQALSGAELDKLSEEDFLNRIENIRVFARVSPEHKVRIVKALKSKGNIVSMTGDGVNDAPSLKIADIGVAMGITGTDVAKGASDMILTDDNFSTIVSAIKEGRNIFNNIKKSIVFLVSCNIGEIVALFIAILLGWPTPLRPIHLLWVNLITDSFPALALGSDPGDPDVIKEKPRNPNEGLFSGRTGVLLILNGSLIGILTLIAFYIGNRVYSNSLIHAQTMAFVVLSVSQLFYSLSMRSSRKTIFELGIFSNKFLIISIIIGIILQNIVISVPLFSSIFKVYYLTSRDWIFVILLSLVPLVINEGIKAFTRKGK